MESFELINWVFPKCFHWIQLIQWQKYLSLKEFEPATSCIWDQGAITAPARHMCDTGSLNWFQFVFQWLIRFPEFTEFLFHLGKTQFQWYVALQPNSTPINSVEIVRETPLAVKQHRMFPGKSKICEEMNQLDYSIHKVNWIIMEAWMFSLEM